MKLPKTTHHQRADKNKRQTDVYDPAMDLAEKLLAQRGVRLNRR